MLCNYPKCVKNIKILLLFNLLAVGSSVGVAGLFFNNFTLNPPRGLVME